MLKKIRTLCKGNADKRTERRVKLGVEMGLVHNGRFLKAEYRDFSQEGLGIKIHGNVVVGSGENVQFSMGNYQIKARIIWVERLRNALSVGLQVMEYRWLVKAPVLNRAGHV